MKINDYIKKSPILSLHFANIEIMNEINKNLEKEKMNFLESLLLLSIYFEREKKAKPSEISKLFITSKGNISHIITKLEKRKLLKRELSRNDARSFDVFITDDGRKKASKLISLFESYENKYEKELKSDIDILINILTKIKQAHFS